MRFNSPISHALLILFSIAFTTGSAHASGDILAEGDAIRQRLFEKVAPTVVFISTGKAFGSGVIISELGLVLTNAHVVDDKKVVQVVLHDGRKFSAPVVERAANDIDLALVQLPVTAVPYLKLENNVDLRVGQWVASVGHGSGGIWTFNTGMVSNIYPDGAEKPVFQTQIPLNPGSSGGPIFNRHGQVVGIVTAGIMESNSINFGIKIDMAMRNLTKLGHLCDCLVITAPKGVPIFVDGKMVGKGGEKLTVPVSRGMHEVFAVIGGKMNKQKVDFPKRRFVNLK